MARMLHDETPGAAEGETGSEAEWMQDERAQDGPPARAEGPTGPTGHFDEDGRPLNRLAIKERCKLAFCSGKARLSELAEQWGIPYHTLMRWSSEEAWADSKGEGKEIAARKAAEVAGEWFAEQRLEHIRSTLARSRALRSAMDVFLTDGDCMVREDGEVVRIPLSTKGMQSLATAEERVDLMIRRNLGMDEQQGAGRINVNINALGDVQLGQ